MRRVKILIPVTLAVLLLLSILGAQSVAYLEDFDRDGQANVLDVVALLRAAITDPDDSGLDYNGDGAFSVADALSMLINIVHGNLHATELKPGDMAHRALADGEVAVTGPGSYSQAGVTYVLTRNVRGPRSAIFLGKDVTLDLNGYTLTYADTSYQHVPNSGFEDGLTGWDISRAPGASVYKTTYDNTFVGENVLYLPAGQELVSPYIELPVAGRTYYAMCGVTKLEMVVTVSVDDSVGNPVNCAFTFGSTTRVTCPETARSPKLGGGFVFAQLKDLPAGKYRIRVKAEGTNCYIDEVDIRPALDVGVGIVQNTSPWSYYKALLDADYAAFTDYTEPGTSGTPVADIPRVEGSGTVTIKNGVIRGGSRGIRSWGVQSTANDVLVVLDNVRFEAEGINTNAVDVPRAEISNCRFEIETPFVIDRHRTGDAAVFLRGPGASRVTDCEFDGGQGCLTVRGDYSEISGNLLINDQMVTNHYSIGAGGVGIKIHDNQILPRTGSGILLGGSDGIEIYNNLFRIATSPPTCEYGNEEYSVNAVRITDYNRQPGEEGAAANNRIYGNQIYLTAVDYPVRSNYIPMVYAVFLSTGGGTNHFYDNTVTVDHRDPHSKAIAAAFYVGGSDNGGEWTNNTVTSNVPPVWVATPYGSATGAKFSRNTFISSVAEEDAPAAVRLGYGGYTAREIAFNSNTCQGMDFAIEKTDAGHSYTVSWTLTVTMLDAAGQPVAGAEVVITDNAGAEAGRMTTASDGRASLELTAFQFSSGATLSRAPYSVASGGVSATTSLTGNTELTLRMQ